MSCSSMQKCVSLLPCVQPVALHMLSAIVFSLLVQYLVNVSSSVFLFVEHALHGLCLPSFPNSLHSSFRSRSRVHCGFAPPFLCISPSMVHFCFSESSNLSPPGFVRTLHPILQAVLRVRRPIEGVSQSLGFLEGSLCSHVLVLILMSSFFSSAYVHVHHRFDGWMKSFITIGTKRKLS